MLHNGLITPIDSDDFGIKSSVGAARRVLLHSRARMDGVSWGKLSAGSSMLLKNTCSMLAHCVHVLQNSCACVCAVQATSYVLHDHPSDPHFSSVSADGDDLCAASDTGKHNSYPQPTTRSHRQRWRSYQGFYCFRGRRDLALLWDDFIRPIVLQEAPLLWMDFAS